MTMFILLFENVLRCEIDFAFVKICGLQKLKSIFKKLQFAFELYYDNETKAKIKSIAMLEIEMF